MLPTVSSGARSPVASSSTSTSQPGTGLPIDPGRTGTAR